MELRNIVIEASHADFTGISLQHLNQACIQVNNFQKVNFGDPFLIKTITDFSTLSFKLFDIDKMVS